MSNSTAIKGNQMCSTATKDDSNMGAIAKRAVDLLCDVLDNKIDIDQPQFGDEANIIIAYYTRRQRLVANDRV